MIVMEIDIVKMDARGDSTRSVPQMGMGMRGTNAENGIEIEAMIGTGIERMTDIPGGRMNETGGVEAVAAIDRDMTMIEDEATMVTKDGKGMINGPSTVTMTDAGTTETEIETGTEVGSGSSDSHPAMGDWPPCRRFDRNDPVAFDVMMMLVSCSELLCTPDHSDRLCSVQSGIYDQRWAQARFGDCSAPR